MIGIFLGQGDEAFTPLLDALESLDEIRILSGVTECLREDSLDAIIVCERRVETSRATLLAEMLGRQRDALPLTWVTEHLPTNLWRLAHLLVSRIYSPGLPAEEVARDLIELSLGGARRDQVLYAVRDRRDWRTSLRRALGLAFACAPPFRRIKDLAASVCVSPSALDKAWRGATRTEVRLKDLLVLLQMAYLERLEGWGLGLEACAKRLGIDPRTVQRLLESSLAQPLLPSINPSTSPWIQIEKVLGVSGGGDSRAREIS